ncbi:hypothetical protein D3C72_1679590 [compost metagenome]
MVQRGNALFDLGNDVGQRVLVDLRIGAQRRERLALALQFLDQVGLEVGAAGHVDDLEDRRNGHVMLLRVNLPEEIIQPIEQVFQAQERPDAFVERIFVQDQGRYPCCAPRGRKPKGSFNRVPEDGGLAELRKIRQLARFSRHVQRILCESRPEDKCNLPVRRTRGVPC